MHLRVHSEHVILKHYTYLCVDHTRARITISGWIAEETGYSYPSVNNYLDQKYKDPDRVKGGLEKHRRAISNIADPVSVEVEAIDTLGLERYEESI